MNDNLGLDKHLGGDLPQWLLSSSGVLLSFLCSALLLKEQFPSPVLSLLELGKKHNCLSVTIYRPFPGEVQSSIKSIPEACYHQEPFEALNGSIASVLNLLLLA